MTLPVSVSQIKSVNWSPELGSYGQVVENIDDINQAIRVILLCPRGSYVWRPDFGGRIFDYVDYPQNEVKSFLISQVVSSVTRWEQRIQVQSVKITFLNDSELGKVQIDIEWLLKLSTLVQVTSIVI